MTKTRLAALFMVVSAGLAFSQGGLPAASRKAKKAADSARLAIELRRISEKLKPPREAEELEDLAKAGRAAVAALKAEQFSTEAVSVLDKLDAIYAGLPQKTWAKDYGADLAAVVALTPAWSADEGGSEEDMSARLDDALVLPEAQPDTGEAFKLFPEDVPLEKFKKINPIVVFLMKHRLKRPKKLAATTPEAVVDGKHHVQVGVTVEGTVTWNTQGSEFDQDWCFNLGNLHLEITPEWRLTHRGFPKPKVGDRVRISGWTYYDSFHKAEHEYDDNDPVMGAQRYTLWEVHPVMDAKILK